MLPRQLIHLTKIVSSLRQPATSYKQTICTTNVDSLRRFYSNDSNGEPSPKMSTDEESRLALIKLELNSLRQDGFDVPDVEWIKKQHWQELLKLASKAARRSYYNFLHVTQKKQEMEKVKKQQKSLVYEAFKKQQGEEDQAPRKSRFLLRIYKQTINKWRNNRLFRAMQFSEKIIFDCSYDTHMNRKESKSAAKQLVEVFSENRRSRDPFDLHFCNVNYNSATFERVVSLMPNLRDENFPLNLHEGSYLDSFPKDKLVYLTPHCKTDLAEFDADAIYIVGAMVDTRNHEPLSMMKAKELGIKMAKLPLERYLDWGLGCKTLTLDQMMKILLEWRATKSWEKALRHVPRRKVIEKYSDNVDYSRQKEVKKWTVSASSSNENYRNENRSFGDGPNFSTGTSHPMRKNFERNTKTNNSFDSDSTRNDPYKLSTAEKFKRNPATNYQSPNKFERSAQTNDDFKRTDGTTEVKQRAGKDNPFAKKFENSSKLDSDRTDGTTDKVKKSKQNRSKSPIDLKSLMDD